MVALKEKAFWIDPLLDFWNELSTQLNGADSHQLAIDDIQTKLNLSRVDYFIKHLVDCDVLELRDGIVTKTDIAGTSRQSVNDYKWN